MNPKSDPATYLQPDGIGREERFCGANRLASKRSMQPQNSLNQTEFLALRPETLSILFLHPILRQLAGTTLCSHHYTVSVTAMHVGAQL